MAEKATEAWKRIHNNAFPDGLIAQIQRIHDLNHAGCTTFDSSIHDLSLVARAALNQGIYDVSRAAASAIQIPLLNSQEDWKQFSQSIVTLAEEFQDIITEINWEPSDELTDSINCALQEAASFQNETNAEIPSELSARKSLPKDYIKTNIWNILGILLNIISILLYFAPNPIEGTTLNNQQSIIIRNQQIIEQNNEQLQLDRERNELLQKLCDTVQAIDDETNLLGEQPDSLVEQDNEPIQTVDSPSSDDAADSKQQ